MDARLSTLAPVFLDYDQAELDRAYDQRVWAPNTDAVMERFRVASAQARATQPMRADIAYGAGADEKLDVFPTDVAGAPIHVHIHGGAWRIQSKHDASFIAPAMTAAGMHFIAPDFTNLPACRMPEMVDQLARALGWVHRNAPSFGGDPDRILLSGHSSGAHLCAVLLTLDWPARGLPADIVKAALCISGAYDLEPVLLSARRLYIDLTTDEAERLSPQRHVAQVRCPVTIMYGERESPEFIRHGISFADALRAAGRDVQLIRVAGVNHFEINEEFGQVGSLPCTAARRLADRLGATRRDGKTP